MTIQLSKQKKQYFTSFLKEMIKGDPLGSAQWLYKISIKNGEYLKENEAQAYMEDLVSMFKKIHLKTLESL
jgi:hypothetical protein